MIKGMVKILLYIVGFSIAAFAVIYTILLILVDLLPENSLKVALVVLTSVILLLAAIKINKEQGGSRRRPSSVRYLV